MKTHLIAALLAVPALAAAQNAGDPGVLVSTAAAAASKAGEVHQLDKEIIADKTALAADRKALKKTGKDEKTLMKDLDEQEKTAVAEVHASFQILRDAAKAQSEAQRKSDRSDIGADAKGMSNDVQERKDIKNSGN